MNTPPEHAPRRPRTLDEIRLTPDEREAIYARMRADRLARGGKPVYDPDVVARSVIWTQYHAGVDARACVETKEPVRFLEDEV